jgi:DNA-binding MarR family transcriptional regulator
MLEVLERESWVFRQPDEEDRRAYKVFLTEAGRELKDKLIPLAEGVLKRGLRGLTAEDIAQAKGVLDLIYNNLE